MYAGHEYTEQNLRFAKVIEPANEAIDRAQQRARSLRGRGKPTLPSTIATECEINPFFRVDEPAVRAAVGLGSDAERAEVFARLRARKDEF